MNKIFRHFFFLRYTYLISIDHVRATVLNLRKVSQKLRNLLLKINKIYKYAICYIGILASLKVRSYVFYLHK